MAAQAPPAAGLSLTNRVVIDKAITVQSVNGPSVTVIEGAKDPLTTNGGAAVRGVWMASNSALIGFTVTNGATLVSTNAADGERQGGGVWAQSTNAIVERCVIVDNTANDHGGGVGFAFLINSILDKNTAEWGGGAYRSSLRNCTVVNNYAARFGGGTAFGDSMRNSIYYGNAAASDYPSALGGRISYCRIPDLGLTGNRITNDPEFVNADLGNYRLKASSPCINAGANAYVASTNDIDDSPRIAFEVVDLGAYEFVDNDTNTVHYVAVSNATPEFPFTTWETAATNIQDAVDVAEPGETVLVSNGMYRTGSRRSPGPVTLRGNNRLVIAKPVTVVSANGPWAATIDGGGTNHSLRCVYMTNSAQLVGFTLTEGRIFRSFDADGAGVFAPGSIVSNCVIRGNRGAIRGGGASGGTLVNCLLTQNEASAGGGAYGCTLIHCTVVANTASGASSGGGGGVFECVATNCIIYHNTHDLSPNWSGLGAEFHHSCTTPLPNGLGNIADNPGFATSFRPSLASPCLAAGTTSNAVAQDIDDESWGVPPSMGCDEVVAGALTGHLQVAVSAEFLSVLPGTPVSFAATIDGRAVSNQWTYGDGDTDSNMLFPSHTWPEPGDYVVAVSAYNEDFPGGVTASLTVSVVGAGSSATYAWTNSPNPTPPYTNWATAAHTIQDAVDAQTTLGGLVLVTDGVYRVGGKMSPNTAWSGAQSNRVLVAKNITVRSVNGAGVTTIEGAGPAGTEGVRCVWMNEGRLDGFTLFNGHADSGGGMHADTIGRNDRVVLHRCVLVGNTTTWVGGGAFGGTLSNCVIYANASVFGGGMTASTLYNCLVLENTASDYGGGCDEGTLFNCTVARNLAQNRGGGTKGSTHFNSIVYFNNSVSFSLSHPNWYQGSFTASCTWPDPGFSEYSVDTITDDPRFLDAEGLDFRLSATSPCIDAGINQAWMFDAEDYDGNRRLISKAVDMGAYELVFQANLKSLLQGPYNTNLQLMASQSVDHVSPTNAPYAADPRSVAAIPSNTTDWALVELRTATNSEVAYSKSVLLRNDGTLFDENRDNVLLEAGPGTYYVVVKHRNHATAMTARPIAFTNRVFFYDFTTGTGQSLGGTNAVIELEPGVWGMIAGDADGDGRVLPVDQEIWGTQEE